MNCPVFPKKELALDGGVEGAGSRGSIAVEFPAERGSPGVPCEGENENKSKAGRGAAPGAIIYRHFCRRRNSRVGEGSLGPGPCPGAVSAFRDAAAGGGGCGGRGCGRGRPRVTAPSSPFRAAPLRGPVPAAAGGSGQRRAAEPGAAAAAPAGHRHRERHRHRAGRR